MTERFSTRKTFEETVFDTAHSQLQAQAKDLATVRGSARYSIAFVAFFATFGAAMLGGDVYKALFSEQVGSLGFSLVGCALIILVASSSYFSIMVITSQEFCNFALNVKEMERRYVAGETPARILLDLAKDMDGFFDDNEKVIGKAQANLQLALILGWAQLIPWLYLWTMASSDG